MGNCCGAPQQPADETTANRPKRSETLVLTECPASEEPPAVEDGETLSAAGGSKWAAKQVGFQDHISKHVAAVAADNPTLALEAAIMSHFSDHEMRVSACARGTGVQDEAIPPDTASPEQPASVEADAVRASPMLEEGSGTTSGTPESVPIDGNVAADEDGAAVPTETVEEVTASPADETTANRPKRSETLVLTECPASEEPPAVEDGETLSAAGGSKWAAKQVGFQDHISKHVAAVAADNPTLALEAAIMSHFSDHEMRVSACARGTGVQDEAIPPDTASPEQPASVEADAVRASPMLEEDSGTTSGTPESVPIDDNVAADEDGAAVPKETVEEVTASPVESNGDGADSGTAVLPLIELDLIEEQTQDHLPADSEASGGVVAPPNETAATAEHEGASSPGTRDAVAVAGAKGNAQNAAVESAARRRAMKKAQKKKQDEAEAADLVAQMRARLAERKSPTGGVAANVEATKAQGLVASPEGPPASSAHT
eukprot:COSAG02_NODE_3722_length_6323_cov_2.892031_3_plen_489_part_00